MVEFFGASRNERRSFGLALPWVLTSLILAVIPIAGHLPAWVTVCFVASAFWRQIAENRGWRLPGLGVRLALFGVTAGAVLLLRQPRGQPDDPDVLAAFLVALISLKLLELRSDRDFTFVALLGYFLVLSCFFWGQSLSLSLYLVLVIMVNTMALIWCHSAPAGQGTSPVRSFGRAARLALALIAQTAPLTVICFLAFPRMEGTFLRGLNFGSGSALTGISDHLTPGSVVALEQSEEIAFRALFDRDGDEEPMMPSRTLYWRAFSLGRCDGLEWTPGDAPDHIERSKAIKALAHPLAGGRLVHQHITIEPHYNNWLFALDRPSEAPDGAGLMAGTGDLRYRSAISVPMTYELDSRIPSSATPTVPPRDLPKGWRDFYLQLPSKLDQGVRKLAQSWKAEAKDDDERIVSLALGFFGNGAFSYTLTPGAYQSEWGDSLNLFLFHRRTGFCEHYATAFSTLMRAAGVPARVVVGYQGGQWNYVGQHYIVRQSDAHAWSEVWLKDRGWKRVDPTEVVAPDRLSYGAESFAELAAYGPMDSQERAARLSQIQNAAAWRRAWRLLGLTWDTLDEQWNLNVVEYSEPHQRKVLTSLGLGRVDWLAGCVTIFVAGAGVIALGFAGVRMIIWGLGRRDPAEDPARRMYGRFCERLAATGVPCRAEAEGPLDFAARAGNALPQAAGRIEEITRLYVDIRYGPPGKAGKPSLETLRMAIRRFSGASRPAAHGVNGRN